MRNVACFFTGPSQFFKKALGRSCSVLLVGRCSLSRMDRLIRSVLAAAGRSDSSTSSAITRHPTIEIVASMTLDRHVGRLEVAFDMRANAIGWK